MNKKIVSLVCLIAVITCVSVTVLLLSDGKEPEKENKITDAIKFSQEYKKVPEKNVFVYRSAAEIVKILENGTGVVFMGFAECPWCQAYAPILNEVAMDIGVEKIFYCDIRKDRADNTAAYKKIVSLLEEHLDYDDEGKPRVFVPEVAVVVDGEIVGHDNETSLISDPSLTPDMYWTEEQKSRLVTKLEEMIIPLASTICSQCE